MTETQKTPPAEQEWKILLTITDASGSHPIHSVTATAPYLTDDGHLEMHDAQGAVVAIFARTEWASVRRGVPVQA